MFIGEMGSWLIVGGIRLYHRYISQSTPHNDGYEPVDTDGAPSGTETNNDGIQPRIVDTASQVHVGNLDSRLPLVGWKISLLSLPAICDICATTLMNIGLLFVVPSIYQMTRGALVLFVGLFSVIFLKKKLHLFHWFALVTVVLGVTVVGLAGALHRDKTAIPSEISILIRNTGSIMFTRNARTPEAMRTVIGVFLIAGAQIFTATQFVLEEFILEKYALEPLRVVGWEGLFGFLVTLLGMMVLHLAVGRTLAGQYGYFDAVEGWRQITTYKTVGIASILIMFSIW